MTGEFTISSRLRATPEVVWRHAVSPAGINREFRPLLRMTFPADVEDIANKWVPGKKLFRSWMLLFGVLPVEYDDLCLVSVQPGERFLERSTLLSQCEWEHERTLVGDPAGCRVTDRLRFTPRIAVMGPVSGVVVRAVFRLRHRNLCRIFGGESA